MPKALLMTFGMDLVTNGTDNFHFYWLFLIRSELDKDVSNAKIFWQLLIADQSIQCWPSPSWSGVSSAQPCSAHCTEPMSLASGATKSDLLERTVAVAGSPLPHCPLGPFNLLVKLIEIQILSINMSRKAECQNIALIFFFIFIFFRQETRITIIFSDIAYDLDKFPQWLF